jgi:hypothetical protein
MATDLPLIAHKLGSNGGWWTITGWRVRDEWNGEDGG